VHKKFKKLRCAMICSDGHALSSQFPMRNGAAEDSLNPSDGGA
jgi:hypothetical protein